MRQLFFALILLFTTNSFGQTLVDATAQYWASGPCCATGTKYNVSIHLSDYSSAVVQEVWLNGYGVVDAISTKAKDSDVINISFEITTNYYDIAYNDEYDFSLKKEGDAQVSLLVDDGIETIMVREFRNLMALQYP
ncbi:MAG: hypothetical protein ACPG4Z_01640 [Chitinophagales bacterium]